MVKQTFSFHRRNDAPFRTLAGQAGFPIESANPPNAETAWAGRTEISSIGYLRFDFVIYIAYIVLAPLIRRRNRPRRCLKGVQNRTNMWVKILKTTQKHPQFCTN